MGDLAHLESKDVLVKEVSVIVTDCGDEAGHREDSPDHVCDVDVGAVDFALYDDGLVVVGRELARVDGDDEAEMVRSQVRLELADDSGCDLHEKDSSRLAFVSVGDKRPILAREHRAEHRLRCGHRLCGVVVGIKIPARTAQNGKAISRRNCAARLMARAADPCGDRTKGLCSAWPPGTCIAVTQRVW